MDFLRSSFPTFSRGAQELFHILKTGFWASATEINDLGSLPTSFYKYDALVGVTWLCVAIIVYSFVWSVVGNNCSKVDQIWSVTPWVFGWTFYLHFVHNNPGASHPRLLLVCLLMTLWGLRLTFNFARRGGYGNLMTHEEDYRWPILRKIIGNWFLFMLFNISFIASYQNLLLLLIALPAYGVMMSPETAIGTSDIVLTIVFIVLLVIETIADQQHYDFQEYKHSLSESARRRHSNPDIKDGFLRQGLFRFCRHPNYFAEQAIWVCVYLFTVDFQKAIKMEHYITVYSAGVILLILLFQGSISFSEGITAKKYPKYALYQMTTSQLIPFFPAKATTTTTTTTTASTTAASKASGKRARTPSRKRN